MPGGTVLGLLVVALSAPVLPAKPPKAPVPGFPASLLIRDSGSWTLRLAQTRKVKGGIEVDASGAPVPTAALLARPLDAAEIVPNQVHTLEFRPRRKAAGFGFDLELIAGPDSLYKGARLTFHVQGLRQLRGLRTSNEHWVSAGTNGTPHVTWGQELVWEKQDLFRLLEFN